MTEAQQPGPTAAETALDAISSSTLRVFALQSVL
ncbi:MAG: hypothetical protein ACJAYI_002022, partial [Myxococcota bacterium]